MANLDITLKRKVGSTAGVYDVLYPTTTIDQVIDLQGALDEKVNISEVGVANGVASLDANSKVPVAQLPDSVFDSLYFFNIIQENKTLAILADEARVNAAATNRSPLGYYWVSNQLRNIPANESIATQIGSIYYQTVYTPGDEGQMQAVGGVFLETGDWIVITKITGAGTSASPFMVTFAVVANTYENASTSFDGVVRLSDATTMGNLVDGSNDVITENFLFDNKLADGSQLASGTNLGKIAPAAHHHDGSYLAIGGTAANATKLATARTIAASGDATWSVSFDGSANVTAGLTLANSGVSAGTFRSVTVDAKGRVTSGTNPTTLSGYGITDAQPLDADLTAIGGLTGTTGLLRKTAANTWSLDTTTFLTGNQTITVSGDATGSGATAIALTLANSGVTAGTYKSVTVDAKGRVTAGTNPTTLSGYGITDAYTQTQVDNLLLTRPEIYYNASANSDGDLVLDLDSDGAVA